MGQRANPAAVELTQGGFGKMACLAGIGARLSGKSVRNRTDLKGRKVKDA